jgi:hypothetical protein
VSFLGPPVTVDIFDQKRSSLGRAVRFHGDAGEGWLWVCFVCGRDAEARVPAMIDSVGALEAHLLSHAVGVSGG